MKTRAHLLRIAGVTLVLLCAGCNDDRRLADQAKMAATAQQWHALRVEFLGKAISVVFDGKQYIRVEDDRIAGEGAVVPLRFGGKSAPNCGDPYDAMVIVKRLVRDAHQSFGTMPVAMGDSALIEVDGVEVILNSERSQAFERTVFSSMGIDPMSKDILVVKSTNHFYADFSTFAADVIYCEAGRPYPNRAQLTPYRKAPRTIWPIVENPWE